MKIAIVHDWLVTDAGAEKVLKNILEVYPEADVFTLVDFLNKQDRNNILNGKYANTSFIQKLPFSKKYFRNYLFLFPKAIEKFDLKDYDLIISSSWAVAKGIKKHKNQVHICYCHTPIRYAWDLYEDYTKDLNYLKKYFVGITLNYIRNWDIKTLDRVDYFIANSCFVQKRIKKTYARDSTVIYPPVNTEKFTLTEKKDDYYITASRLVPYKKTKLIVEAFNEMSDKKLIVLGDGEDYENLKRLAKSNIILKGHQNNDSMIKYLQNAKAFVYAAVEDFGILPVEAMSCGTPVIALNNGGTSETVINKVNGLHFDKQDKNEIIKKIYEFENIKFDYKLISSSSKKYAQNEFKLKLKNKVKEVLISYEK